MFEFRKFDFDEIEHVGAARGFYDEETDRATKYIRNLEEKFKIAAEFADIHVRVEDTENMVELITLASRATELTTQWREIKK